ncbi:7-carboxy-7-deazaguanine synthase (Cx14CxxC type) [Rhizomicrobium palustre]|uniref:7-carboxy-7-deazaguanine synthase n=1 Tax=Rhizomicrobium palustre TaxID=189966 RepID=A0A846N314_9PROT|nr:7-carboxy-7-deazaguanine synthase (Cx14CxxC type) [Rhizomicrobium palustre]
MSYAVKEIFYTLQGEGARAGRASVFLRFSGCNLWNGLERDRAHAICQFCDTDFVGTDGEGGGKFATAEELAKAVSALWPNDLTTQRYVVCTGGEPLLQLDEALIEALHGEGFEIAIESNGTQAAPRGIEWICISPKAGAGLVQMNGQELKLVYPQQGLDPSQFEKLMFENFYLQPMDGPAREENTKAAIAYCLAHPRWKLSLQTHKLLGIP